MPYIFDGITPRRLEVAHADAQQLECDGVIGACDGSCDGVPGDNQDLPEPHSYHPIDIYMDGDPIESNISTERAWYLIDAFFGTPCIPVVF